MGFINSGGFINYPQPTTDAPSPRPPTKEPGAEEGPSAQYTEVTFNAS